MKLCNIGHEFDYEMEKLIRLFLPFEKIEVIHTVETDTNYAVCKVDKLADDTIVSVKLNLDNNEAEFSAALDKTIPDTRKETQHELGRQLLFCFEKIILSPSDGEQEVKTSTDKSKIITKIFFTASTPLYLSIIIKKSLYVNLYIIIFYIFNFLFTFFHIFGIISVKMHYRVIL